MCVRLQAFRVQASGSAYVFRVEISKKRLFAATFLKGGFVWAPECSWSASCRARTLWISALYGSIPVGRVEDYTLQKFRAESTAASHFLASGMRAGLSESCWRQIWACAVLASFALLQRAQGARPSKQRFSSVRWTWARLVAPRITPKTARVAIFSRHLSRKSAVSAV